MIYPFSVYQMVVEDHNFWVAESATLKGCVGQGETPEEAIQELCINEAEWLDMADELQMEIPTVPVKSPSQYSGKFTVRVSSVIHENATLCAQKEGISLNQYVNDAIIEKNTKADILSQVKAIMADAHMDLIQTVAKFTTETTKWRQSPGIADSSDGLNLKYAPSMLS